MKKSFIWGLAIPLFTGLFMMSCHSTDEFRYSLTLTLDKTEASVGDTVTATVLYKNTNNIDIEVDLPDWIVAEGGNSKEDMLIAIFVPVGNFKWKDYISNIPDVEIQKKYKFKLKRDEVVMRKFAHTITEVEDIEVHAAAFFHYYREVYPHGLIKKSIPKKIKIITE